MTYFDRMLDGMKASATVLILWKGEIDDKICEELGMAMFLDKPIVIAAVNNPQIPYHVRTVAKTIIQVGEDTDTWDMDVFRAALLPHKEAP